MASTAPSLLLVIHKVLILAYFFPPIGSSGIHRTIRYVKHLPDFGWQPYVVSGANSIGMEGYDETSLSEINADVSVERVRAWPDATLRQKIRRLLGLDGKGASRTAPRSRLLSVILKVARLPLVLIVQPPPDPWLYWSLCSIWRCLRIIKRHKIDLIYTTSWPWSAHLAGLALKTLTGKPLAVDFRDPWTLNAIYRYTGVRQKLGRYLECLVLRKADLVICNHRPMRDDFIRLAGPCNQHKFVVITNGYDADDFDAVSRIIEERQALADAEITLAHVGQVYPEAALPLFKALELLHLETPELVGKLRMRFVGGLAEPDRAYITHRPWHDRVEVIERQPHKAAIAHMLRADILLLLLTDEEAGCKWYPSKMFEYLYCNKPILAIMPSGIATELIAEAGAGISFGPSQVESIAALLRWLANDLPGFRKVHFRPRPEIIAQYEARKLTARLASAFDGILTP